MAIKTITLSGGEVAVTELNGAHAHIRNDGADIIYAAKTAGLSAGADGVIAVPAGNAAALYGISGAVYLAGTGSATVVTSDFAESPFKTSAQAGGSGADEVARAAISAYAGNAEIHLTANDVAGLAINPNLLINPDFAVNQRRASGTITEAGYFVDRWRLVSGSVAINSDGTLTLNGTISQTLEKAAGTNVTASASAGTASYDNAKKTFTLTASGEIIAWAKLEPGENATPFYAPDYATELAKCQRLFQRIGGSGASVQNIGFGCGFTTSSAVVQIPLPVTMRASPEVNLNGTLYLSGNSHIGSGGYQINTISGSNLSMNGISLTLSTSESLVNIPVIAQLRGIDNYIDLSAEL